MSSLVFTYSLLITRQLLAVGLGSQVVLLHVLQVLVLVAGQLCLLRGLCDRTSLRRGVLGNYQVILATQVGILLIDGLFTA